ncbi:ATP-binding cassette domain-containing protein [Lactiplantibacillus mudanjiangensis]|uniref:ATP-binding cassette protein [Lactobacillus plantarum] n=1 Tax=Lactiplantibacillus mudanjiangensis TaxID=1296538 RepID=A0A660DYJ6_9LACO|nr:ATP-binding cassette domain-containing protein [Lactiplantibacillus mudanjiangensis]VDG18038.1 ATP-binding cassette protein [Lactobacillus plantarum] [Lactiplantibacillus mudanjiangensis]VDG24795.1 ATP-binding cassette protein [Lactobacillus plantarum] [Lactiplantibacillus mudanjiangensis]VDG28458.1 ATP-binding cassette protein [Lactobacillus plantarum] [Lactiplantibacillus mudanjiangensis]
MNNNQIEIQDVSKKIKKALVLDNINLTFVAGQTYGLTGINGSGKTMILRAIAGLIKPSVGCVKIGDQVIKMGGVPEGIGAMIENPSFINEFTGAQNLELLSLLSKNHKLIKNEINNILDRVGLDPEDKRLFHKYSLGMKQRLGIAQAIIGQPKIVLLDEPTNALDEAGIKRLVKIINQLQENNVTIIVASHDRSFLQAITDNQNIIRLENGQVVSEVDAVL